MLDEPLVPLPRKGRVFRARRRVRLADAAPSGRLRLDACARYLQDIGNDDTADSGIDAEAGAWVVRRAVIDMVEPPRWGEWLDLATWCGGVGRRWAERRLSISGEGQGSVEITTLWVHLDPETLAPARLPESFMRIYGEAAGDRRVTSRFWLDPPADAPGGSATERDPDENGYQRLAWPTRATDFDVMRHMNNAAYWAAVEEVLLSLRSTRPRHPLLDRPLRAVLEYGPGIGADAEVELLVARDEKQVDVWFRVDGAVHATARLVPLPVS